MDRRAPWPKHVTCSPSRGGRRTFDDGVDLDDLIDVSQERHAEQRRRRHIGIEARTSLTPRVEQVLMRPDDVDRELMDVVTRKPVEIDQCEQVVEALPGLRHRVAWGDDVRGAIARNLTGHEQPAADAIGIPVVRGLGEARAESRLRSSSSPSART